MVVDGGCIPGYIVEIKATCGSLFLWLLGRLADRFPHARSAPVRLVRRKVGSQTEVPAGGAVLLDPGLCLVLLIAAFVLVLLAELLHVIGVVVIET